MQLTPTQLNRAATAAAVKIASDFGMYADKQKHAYKDTDLDREAIGLVVKAIVSGVEEASKH